MRSPNRANLKSSAFGCFATSRSAPGSIGAGTTPGRVIKGLRMAGKMGNEQVTVRGLLVVRADANRNLLLIKGAVPGPRNGLVTVSKGQADG